MDLTHASFFSGVGGVDLGLERAGWRTVSFSEIDPYANAVLAHHWPDVPNLGSITDVASRAEEQQSRGDVSDGPGHPDWWDATLWTGGFPCQDLSVAGRRAGFAGARSSLAFAFLRLVGVHRPRAILLENVPGLLSSHGGRDLGALLGAMVELGYGVAWRELDAKHFGVPQRRRRIFVLGLRCDPDDTDGHLAAVHAAEVLAVGTRCDRHPPPGGEKGKGAAGRTRGGASLTGGGVSSPQSGRVFDPSGESPSLAVQDRWGGPEAPAVLVGAIQGTGPGGGWRIGADEAAAGQLVVGAEADAGGVREVDGMAGRLDDRASVAYYVAPESGQGADLTAHTVETAPALTVTEYEKSTDRGIRVFTKSRRAQSNTDHETWVEGDATPTINPFDASAVRATTVIAQSLDQKKGGVDDNEAQAGHLAIGGLVAEEDPLLPPGLDSNRYRCCGNGVVAPVAEWIGHRLAEYLT